MELVLRSCQTMALWYTSPVEGSNGTTVSLWFVIPMAATWEGWTEHLRIVFLMTVTVLAQISSTSCSTQPGCGKCCLCSFWSHATISPSSLNRMKRVLVVPWSIAPMYLIMPPFESNYRAWKVTGQTDGTS